MSQRRYDRLVHHHRDAVYRQMVRTCGNYDDAEDVLIEALLKAHKALDTLHDEGAFRSWLTRIGKRVCYRLRKREALLPILSLSGLGIAEAEISDPGDFESEMLEMERMKACIVNALDELPPKLRKVYEKRELEGISGARVALELGIQVGAVKTRLHRARAIVRNSLDQGMCGHLWSGT